MKRFDDWPHSLDVFLTSRRDVPFRWGENDCCLFACDAILIMTGVDLAHGFRASYDTARSARRFIRECGAEGVGELADQITAQHGLRCVPPSFAQRGDLVLLEGEHGESLGIVSLCGTEILAPAEHCLAAVPFGKGERAWRI
jgi:hypothetical protein